MTAKKSFPKPSELPVPAGAEGWEKIYPYYLVFQDKLKDAEDAKFWFCDSQHWPTVFKPFETIGGEFAVKCLGQYNARHLMIPNANGIEFRVHLGYLYMSPIPVPDEQIAARVPEFEARIGHYFGDWENKLAAWHTKVKGTIADMEALRFDPLPEIVPFEDIENGVGKELVARLLHSMSRRREQAFIPVNCSAIPPDLFESEFFGYEKGAFTGANARGKAGLLQMAGGGTLFLDELGELPLMMQSKLLRFVETGEFYPVGSTRPTRVDVRIISATNRDLLRMMADKTFREDLYYRLHVIPLQIPPLRERPEDVETIAVFFLEKFNKKYEKSLTLSDRELELLRRYRWPGNVRELRNTIERLVLLSDEGRAEQTLRSMLGEAGPLPDASQEPQAARMPEFADWDLPLHQALERFEQIYIRTALKRCGGNMQAAARALGVHRSTLYRKRAEEGEACPPPLTE